MFRNWKEKQYVEYPGTGHRIYISIPEDAWIVVLTIQLYRIKKLQWRLISIHRVPTVLTTTNLWQNDWQQQAGKGLVTKLGFRLIIDIQTKIFMFLFFEFTCRIEIRNSLWSMYVGMIIYIYRKYSSHMMLYVYQMSNDLSDKTPPTTKPSDDPDLLRSIMT